MLTSLKVSATAACVVHTHLVDWKLSGHFWGPFDALTTAARALCCYTLLHIASRRGLSCFLRRRLQVAVWQQQIVYCACAIVQMAILEGNRDRLVLIGASWLPPCCAVAKVPMLFSLLPAMSHQISHLHAHVQFLEACKREVLLCGCRALCCLEQCQLASQHVQQTCSVNVKILIMLCRLFCTLVCLLQSLVPQAEQAVPGQPRQPGDCQAQL